MFSGLNSIHYLAREMDYKRPIVSQFFQYRDVVEYSKAKIPIGVNDLDDIFFIPTKKSFRALMIGKQGSGKTFLMQSLMSRYHKIGNYLVNLTDIKPEMYLSNRPLQEKFRKFLMKNELPEGLPIKNYHPFFFSNLVFTTFPNTQFCQFSLPELNSQDLLAILNIDPFDYAKINAIESSLKKVGTEINSLKEFKEDLKSVKGLNSPAKNSLLSSIEMAERCGLIGDDYPFSFTQDLLDNRVPNLNLYGFEKMGEYTTYPQLYVAIILRKLLADKTEKVLVDSKKLMINIDELARFCPNDGAPISKKMILELIEVGRRVGISVLMSTQSPDRIPDAVLQACDYLFLPHNITTDIAKDVIKRMSPQEYDHPFKFNMTLSARLSHVRKYRDGSRDWLCIDRDGKDIIQFKPFAPLCYHLEEAESA